MGMYDSIFYKTTCNHCGEPLSEFQSKSGDNVLARLTPKQLFRITKTNSSKVKIYGLKSKVMTELPVFYESCPKCGSWEEYVIKPNKLGNPRVIAVKSDSNV